MLLIMHHIMLIHFLIYLFFFFSPKKTSVGVIRREPSSLVQNPKNKSNWCVVLLYV